MKIAGKKRQHEGPEISENPFTETRHKYSPIFSSRTLRNSPIIGSLLRNHSYCIDVSLPPGLPSA
ncbi:hypothetical protein DERP_009748 [Dermatophagoides pteronyssinus]|uniref:Uncharacterized protein n=1 Tax=Dermatophagoides pteronyssinus TaxID=6956 RepID=A0ABQ8IRF6_DERPT|nr:hypothetical protein DERP_009748 [Dermatophagoides pteronyssinus]